MAKTLDELKNIRQQMSINLHTVKDEAAVKSFMKESAWTGEVAVQQIKNDKVKLWTLGKDNVTAVDFIDRQTIEGLIASASSLVIASATPSTVNVLEEWKLINLTTSAECGEHIKIYKDRTIKTAKIDKMDATIDAEGNIIPGISGETALCIVYILADGSYSLVTINLQHFIEENEFESGVTCENHIVHGVVAPFGKTNDNFLFVDGDGFYTSGITESIALEIVSAATTDETVKEAWKLFNKKLNKQYGEIINIYKDQNVVNVYIGHVDDTISPSGAITYGSGETGFNLVKLNAEGKHELIKVNMQRFIEETEIGHGLEMSGHTLVGKVASGITSPDNHLFVDDRGFYLSGLTEILPVLYGLTMAKAKASSDRYGYVTVDSAKTGEHLTYTVSGYDIASYTVVGSGWVSSSITEVIIENEKITAKALNNIAKCISALTPSSEDKTVVITPSFSGTDYSVNIDNKTIGKDDNGVLSTLLMIASAVPSTANVYEEWRLVDQNYDEISGSSHIMIYKDSALIQVYIGKTDDKCDPITGVITPGVSGATALCFLYMLADGTYELVTIDVTLFFSEEIFKKGFDVNKSAHTIDVKIDEKSEPYLTVSMAGVKLSGVSAMNATELTRVATTNPTVREAWRLYNPVLKKQYGEILNVYKDQRIVNAYIGHYDDIISSSGAITVGSGETAFNLVKLNDEEKYELIKVNTQRFIEETECFSGVGVDNHILHGVVAPSGKTNDNFLYVDGDGFYTSGITESLALEIVSAATTNEKVKESWKLFNKKLNKQYGEIINIYKDQNIVNAYIGHVDDTINASSGSITVGSGETGFNLVKLNAEGKYELINTNMQRFIEETEIGHGLEMSGHTLVGKVASGITTPDNHLFVDDRGFFLSGLTELLPMSSGHTILVGVPTPSGTNVEVNIDNKTIGKDLSGVLSTLLLISAVTPSAGIKEEYALVDVNGDEISGSTHIKIGQTCQLSGLTYESAETLSDRYGYVTVDSAMTSAGTMIYTVSGYNIASYTVVGSGWVASSITEVIKEDEEIFVNALVDLDERVSANTEAIKILQPKSEDKTININSSLSGTNYEVNIDNRTIGKSDSGVLSTLLLISAVTPSAGVKEEYALVDVNGDEISGSTHIKIGQTCMVSGLTYESAKTESDRYGHVTVDSAMTSAGTMIYTVSGYNIASYTVVGSGWPESSITEVIIENEEIFTNALTSLDLRVSANTEAIKTLYPFSEDKTININSSLSGTNYEVNIDNKTIGKDLSGVLSTLLLISSVTPSAGVKEEYALVDVDGVEISGSTHIKIGQTCIVSGETMASAITSLDRLGHVVVDSAMTSAGTVIYTVDRYDIAASSVVGSGWTAKNMTEAIIENEEILSNALTSLDLRVSANTAALSTFGKVNGNDLRDGDVTIVAPTANGTANQVLLSSGSNTPAWSDYKFRFLTQAEYDALPLKDAHTIYFIIG